MRLPSETPVFLVATIAFLISVMVSVYIRSWLGKRRLIELGPEARKWATAPTSG